MPYCMILQMCLQSYASPNSGTNIPIKSCYWLHVTLMQQKYKQLRCQIDLAHHAAVPYLISSASEAHIQSMCHRDTSFSSTCSIRHCSRPRTPSMPCISTSRGIHPLRMRPSRPYRQFCSRWQAYFESCWATFMERDSGKVANAEYVR